MPTLPSEFDEKYMPVHRDFINNFIKKVSDKILKEKSGLNWLEIGRQEQNVVKNTYTDRKILTLDLVADYDPDLIGDLTTLNEHIPSGKFGGIFCMEVLEHSVDPFASIAELSRLLTDGGFLVLSTPLNGRIHGPVPDCWRFTEFGLNILLRNFDIEIFEKLDTPGRNLFPLHYAVLAYKNSKKNVDPRKMKFNYID
jgi:hypothetical protein